jgi:iron-sulfur cluster assembly accessory protein
MASRAIGKIITATIDGNKQLYKMAKNHNTAKIFFKVKGGGCNGFNYSLKPHKGEVDSKDEIIEFENFNLIVCNHSLFHLLGTEIDYKTDLMGSRFVFNNPRAKAKCGCGTSFSI